MVDRTVAPAFVEPNKFILPEPETIQFKNGSRFLFLNVGDQPVIRLEFIFKAGSWFESIPGVAFFTGKMLIEGTKSFVSKEIAKTLDQYGAFVEVNPGFDYLNLSIHIPTLHFSKIAPVVREILWAPSFPDHEFDLLKQIQLQQLKINEQKNNFVASRLFRSSLYGDFPYGHVMTEDSINQLTVRELTTHFEQYIKGSFDAFLTGKFDHDFQHNLIKLFEKELLNSHAFESMPFNSINHFEKHVEKKESLQSSIFMGKRCINRNHKSYGKVLLLNEVFGGYFGSRLMQNIREDKGLTYGIYSHLVTLKNDAYFVISSDVKKENKDIAISEIRNEIEKLKNELIEHEELQQVKNYLKGSVLNTLTTPFALTEKLKNIHFYDLSSHFYQELFNEIDQTTSEELLDLANGLLFDRELSIAVVG